MDSAPGVPEVMKEIHTVLKADPATPARYQPIEEFNPSWDSLYPSAFATSRAWGEER